MQQMTDPLAALRSFQTALDENGTAELGRCATDPNLYTFSDQPNGKPRLTYVRLDHRTVTALIMFAMVDRLEEGPRFQVGYAVPEKYRSQGRAKEIARAAIAELQQWLARGGVAAFSIEAVVGRDNEPSMRVARATISSTPTEITDAFSGLPAFHFLRNV